MTETSDCAAQQAHEDASSVVAVITSPRALMRETLAGVLTTLALIPEVISFSFVSGVTPTAALFSSVVLALAMSLLGGRPAMVTAAAGSVALVVGPMAKTYGVAYILPTVLLAGVIQIAFGAVGLARLTRFIPRSVMIGFVNSLGILIFLAQVPHVIGAPPAVYPLFALTLAIVLLAPRATTFIPAPLIAIVVVTAIAHFGGFAAPSVGGAAGALEPQMPGFTPFVAPLTLETLKIVWPTALSVALVGLLETLMTAKLVDEITQTRSSKRRESCALGVANFLAGVYGGVAGCAMIAQTIVNVKIGGGRSRISTAAAALTLLALVTVLNGLMSQIPLAALAAVMMIAAIKTFVWRSVAPATLERMPLSETCVLATTMAVTVATGNLAFGVGGGVLLAMALFARRVAHVIRVDRTLSDDGADVRYEVHGPLFFGSSNDLVDRFSYSLDPNRITVDFTHSQIWDASSVAALDAIEAKYRSDGRSVAFTGLDARSLAFHGRLTGQLQG